MWSWLHSLMRFIRGEESEQERGQTGQTETYVRPSSSVPGGSLQARTKSIYPKEREAAPTPESFNRQKRRAFKFPVIPDEKKPDTRAQTPPVVEASRERESSPFAYKRSSDDSAPSAGSRNTRTGRNADKLRNQEKPDNTVKPREAEMQPQMDVPRTSPGRRSTLVNEESQPSLGMGKPAAGKRTYIPSEVISPVFGKITPESGADHRIHTTAGVLSALELVNEQQSRLKQDEQNRLLASQAKQAASDVSLSSLAEAEEGEKSAEEAYLLLHEQPGELETETEMVSALPDRDEPGFPDEQSALEESVQSDVRLDRSETFDTEELLGTNERIGTNESGETEEMINADDSIDSDEMINRDSSSDFDDDTAVEEPDNLPDGEQDVVVPIRIEVEVTSEERPSAAEIAAALAAYAQEDTSTDQGKDPVINSSEQIPAVLASANPPSVLSFAELQTAKLKEKMEQAAARGFDRENASQVGFGGGQTSTPGIADPQTSAEQSGEEPVYTRPSLDLLAPSPTLSEDDDEHTQLQKLLLEETLTNFNVNAQVVGIVKGPSVTRFEIQPAPGVKVNKITGLIDDIKLNLAAKDIRIEAPIPGRNAVGIEVPNLTSQPVLISRILESEKFQAHPSPLAVALGIDIGGEPIVADIKKMPHGLIAGSTGSGKSVCINSIIVSLLYKANPEQVRLLLIDPKMVELAPYNHLPHLVTPVVTDAKQATAALKWAVEEMEKRYALFVDAGVRDIDRYNQTTDEPLPFIVIVIDELADLMMVSPQDVEDCIIRIAQKARACGIHLLLATQRPSVDVITGNIKANVPTRLAFAVFSQVDSRTILDQSGAERLLGRGDMLFLESGTTPIRLQGNYVSDDEIEAVTQSIKKQRKPAYLFSKEDLEQQVQSFDHGDDALYHEALLFVAEQGQASASGLQRRFRVGYNRAARLIEMMEADGYVAGQSGGKPRAVLITLEDAQALTEGTSLF
ncbi:DNA translocase FtsK [Brevibacillus ruminantium]|uniref:DNA translocase FtsK n=1 Tax=Brevibacillus ruminantium TaxID=2950604 RepID=A0ABY4WJ20_9BACL|nr:DNA translocase FtsK [Brevibacillus ruminantium]USG67125.1 DNA translocase FtsK [Brevibacillus ruminantium]